DVVLPKLNASGMFAMRTWCGEKSLNQIVRQTTRESLQRMQNWRRRQDLVAFPFFVGLTRADPFATCQLCVARDMGLLFRRTAYDKGEIIRVQMQTVMLQQLWPRHSSRFQIIEQGSALSHGQRICPSRQ